MTDPRASLVAASAVIDHNLPKGWALVISNGDIVGVVTPEDVERWERNEQPGRETSV